MGPAATRPVPGAALTLPTVGSQLHLWVLWHEWLGDRPEEMVTAELSEQEQRRAAGFVRDYERLTYLSAHISLRRVLSAYTGIAPGELPLAREPCSCGRGGGQHGRPVLAGSRPLVQFSLSHSHGVVLIAVARERVGVDVQRVPSARTTERCIPELHPREQAELNALPDEDRPLAFGELWSRKEAYLKGLGSGLTRSPALDDLGRNSDGPQGWQVRNVPSCPVHVAAAALLSPDPMDIVARRLPTESLYVDDATELIASERRVCPNSTTSSHQE
jgi:4'-phosphopantetheinyl transferase